MQVKFKEWNCEILFKQYSNKRTAIVLRDSEDGSPIATATINLLDIPLQEDEVIIKDYAENEGMYEALLEAGVIAPSTYSVQSGYVICPVCKLLITK